MNMQEVFDKAAVGILTQGVRSTGVTSCVSHCMYRDSDGNKCAIGHVIPEEEYSPEMETYSIGLLLELFEVPSLKGISIEFLDGLQCIHDHYLPYQWYQALTIFAKGWNLSTEALEKFNPERKDTCQ